MRNKYGFTDKIEEFVSENELLASGESVLVCLSGGADSVCLLRVLCDMTEKLDLKLCAAHVNHMLRGTDSDDDERFCKDLCDGLGIKLYTLRADVARIAADRCESVETAAREVRYEFFFELKQKNGFDKIATAHNQNDNAETSLIYYIRGSGIDGVKGIPPKRGDGVIRPLLCVQRNEIEQYLSQLSQTYVTDKTNFEDEYTRNKVRLNLLPALGRDYNPNIIRTIADNALLLGLDSAYLNRSADELYKRIAEKRNGNVCVNAGEYAKSDKALGLRVIRRAIADVKGSTKDISYDTVMRCNALFGCDTHGKSVSISKECFAWREYGTVFFGKKPAEISFCHSAEIGETYIPEIDTTFILSLVKNMGRAEKNCAYFDYNCLEGQIYIRNRKDGDRFVPFNMKGSKRLKDFFIDEKVSAADRNSVPLVVCGDEVLWVCGMRRSGLYTVGENTKQILRIEFWEGKSNANA